MDVEIYRNFLAVIETGSVTAAAEHVHISQPSLSKQLKTLETFYDSQLLILNRGKHRIILTEAGRILYHKAKFICSLEDLAKSEIADVTGGITGVLRISVSYSRSPLFIHRSIKDFSKLYPKITYEIYEAIASEQAQQLLNGITELGITSTTLIRPESFEVLFSRPERMVAVFNINSPWLDNKKRLLLKDLKDIPISLSGGGAEIFRQICLESDFTPNIMSVNTTKSTALQWAKDNIAVALIPSEDVEIYEDDLIVKKINDKRFNTQKDLVKVKDRPLSKIAERFVHFYKKQLLEEK